MRYQPLRERSPHGEPFLFRTHIQHGVVFTHFPERRSLPAPTFFDPLKRAKTRREKRDWSRLISKLRVALLPFAWKP